MDDCCVLKVPDRHRGVIVDVFLDPEDYERFAGSNWFIDKNGYARRNQWIQSTRSTKTMLLHRCVLNVEWESADEKCVDHINGNRIDNRKENLRIVSYAENASNRHVVLTETGVLRISKSGNTFFARIRKDGIPVYIGSFPTLEKADEALHFYQETGLFPYEKRRRRSVLQKSLSGEVLAIFPSCKDASEKTGVCAENICRVANHNRRRKQAGGFVWEYADS